MGRPIAKRFFGTGATQGDIRCRFKTAGTEYDGYVVKQLGSKRFRVTDGSVTAVCTLTNKNNAGLSNGDMTIRGKLDNTTNGYVSKISGRKCTLVSLAGAVIGSGPWNFGVSTADGFIQLEESGGMAAGAERGNVAVTTGSTDFAGNVS